jgi:hypothetical protein
MGVERKDVVATSEDVYRTSLEQKVVALQGKTWAQLTPEEKDAVLEHYAFRSGFVRAP